MQEQTEGDERAEQHDSSSAACSTVQRSVECVVCRTDDWSGPGS